MKKLLKFSVFHFSSVKNKFFSLSSNLMENHITKAEG